MNGLRFVASCVALLLPSLLGLQAQGVNIGSNQPPHPTATLEVSGTQGGLLLPRLTTVQRNQLVSPSIGLVIYNLTTECVESYFPTGWGALRCNCTAPPSPPSQVIGVSSACPGASNLVFSVSPVAGATSYQWTIPGQDTLVQGQGTSSITINLSALSGNRTLQVAAINGCGSSANTSYTLAVSPPSALFSVNPSPVITNNPASFSPSQVGATYVWTFAGGTPATSNASNPSVTWSTPGSYVVDLTVTDGAGCATSASQNITVTNCVAQSWTFTQCSATGRSGPSQSQCNTAYGPGVVTVTSGVQFWTVPATGTYRITANGAQGGNGGGRTGGLGASMRGDFTLTAGSVIKILVGQQGGNRVGSSANDAGAGGGGSFVTLNDNTPLIVAGGGGGAGSTQNGLPGATGLNGTGSGFSSGQGGVNGGGGGGGQNGTAGTQSTPGGNGSSCSYGAGGGGFYTNGGENCSGSAPNIKGLSFLSGGLGGPADTGRSGVEGGFGGGAGVGHRAAGGGGWSGGGGDGDSYGGGGGGSFNNGSNPVNTSGVQSGHGSVIFQRICP